MSIKAEVRKLLVENNREKLVELLLDDRRVVTALNRLLFDSDELIRWRAVTGLGWVAEEDPFLLEKVISRLFYTMNDDSGSIGWMAPQALGEICANDADLVEDFFPIIISSMEVEWFRAGALWAVARIAPLRPDLVEDAGPAVVGYMKDPNPLVRAQAALAAGQLNHSPAVSEIKRLCADETSIRVYEAGNMVETTVGKMAESALKKIE